MGIFKNELERFVYDVCYYDLMQAINNYLCIRPAALSFLRSRVPFPTEAQVQSMMPQFMTNASIENDSLFFDAILNCDIYLCEEDGEMVTTDQICGQWLKVSCEVVIQECLKSVKVHHIQPYSRTSFIRNAGLPATTDCVPIIRREDLDAEAEAFLKLFYPDALITPMRVPIEEIILKNMHLQIEKQYRLTNDFSVFGQIILADSKVQVFDVFDNTAKEINASRGTIFVDPCTFFGRNIGCVNNTLAHEAYHWYRHRIYAAVKSILNNDPQIACRCPAKKLPEYYDDWSNEDRMEWQANKIAPRILMPLRTFTEKVNSLMSEYEYDGEPEILECIIDELSTFYGVSKQSAKYRLIDIGYEDARNVYNYEQSSEPLFSAINLNEAFYEYSDNPEFRKLIDSGRFVYINSYFVINDPRYVVKNADGTLAMTDYAWSNIAECTIQFTRRRVNTRKHATYYPDIFHRSVSTPYMQVASYEPSQNGAVVEYAEQLEKLKNDFSAKYSEHRQLNKTFSQQMRDIISIRHWNSTIFEEVTGLNKMTFTRIMNDDDYMPDIRTVVSICAGLELLPDESRQLLALAGHTLGENVEHQAYGYVLSALRGKPFDVKSDFLMSVINKPLGSVQRR